MVVLMHKYVSLVRGEGKGGECGSWGVSSSGFRVGSFEFRVQVSDFGFQGSGFRFRVSGLGEIRIMIKSMSKNGES
jgi:hypothetical protein